MPPPPGRMLVMELAALAAAGLIASGCASHPTAPETRFEFTRPEMGMPFRIALYAPDAGVAQAAAEAAFDRIHQLNTSFSDYEDDSEVTLLNRTAGQGRAVVVSQDLWNILLRAQALARQTDGAFDVTVGPYVNLWRRARRHREFPRSDLLERARAAVGYENLRLDSRYRTAELRVPNMRLDLGAIAKGYAIDEALKTLRRHQIHSALVTGSGDMAMSDPPPGKPGWRIAIAPLDVTNAPPTRYVLLARRALATSGDVFQHVEIDGRRYSHILDPKTGVGLTDHSLVTVIAKDCMTADSLATAVSVLGPARGIALIEQTPGTAVHLVRKPGDRIEMSESPGFGRFYEPAGAPPAGEVRPSAAAGRSRADRGSAGAGP